MTEPEAYSSISAANEAPTTDRTKSRWQRTLLRMLRTCPTFNVSERALPTRNTRSLSPPQQSDGLSRLRTDRFRLSADFVRYVAFL